MKNPVATWKFWCRKESTLFEFDLEISHPYKEADLWQCDWSLGKLHPHNLCSAKSISSMHALVIALLGISTFLRQRQNAGDMFFTDAEGQDIIEDFGTLFPVPHSVRP